MRPILNFWHLRAFHAVAEGGSFTRAAQRLHITQPTLSEQVRALEAHYKVSLFSRQGRSVVLTPLGEELHTITRRLDAVEAEAAHCLSDAQELRSGQIRLSADAPVHAMRLLAQLEGNYPGIEVSPLSGNSAKLLDDVLNYRTDVAVIADVEPDDRLFAVPFVRNDLTGFVHVDDELADRDTISATELTKRRLILREQGSVTRRCFDQALLGAGLTTPDVLEVDTREAVHVAVTVGLGVGIVAETELPDDHRVAAVALRDLDLTITEYLVCRAERRETRLIAAAFNVLEPIRARSHSAEPNMPKE